MKTTVTPPEPTPEERAKFWFGRDGSARGQHARKNKHTGEVELWWAADEGRWSRTYTGIDVRFMVTKPRLNLAK